MARQADGASATARARQVAAGDALGGLLARCVAGRCDCGGACATDAEQRAQRELQRAKATRRTLSRVADASMCCSDDACMEPDKAGSGATATSWQLILAVDREEKGWARLGNPEDVGHTWVKLRDNAGEQWSFGHWPQGGFDFVGAVKGCVHHPDTEHDPPASTEYREIAYDLTREQFYDALEFAQQQCQLSPDYSLTSYNCTTFAIGVARAAWLNPPASTTLAVHNPNALYTGIGQELKKRGQSKEPVKGVGSKFGKGPRAADPEVVSVTL